MTQEMQREKINVCIHVCVCMSQCAKTPNVYVLIKIVHKFFSFFSPKLNEGNNDDKYEYQKGIYQLYNVHRSHSIIPHIFFSVILFGLSHIVLYLPPCTKIKPYNVTSYGMVYDLNHRLNQICIHRN